MKRPRTILAAGMAVLALLGTGCEAMGQKRVAQPVVDEGGPRHKSELTYAGKDDDDSLAGSARSSGSSARSRGAWSSEAADVEKNLTGRSANPTW